MQTAHFKSTTEAIKNQYQILLYCSSLRQHQAWRPSQHRWAHFAFCLVNMLWSAACPYSTKSHHEVTQHCAGARQSTLTLKSRSCEKKKEKSPNHLRIFFFFSHLMVVKVCVRRGGNSDEATLSRNWDDHKGKQSANILTVHRSLCIKHAASQPTPSPAATADAGAGSEVKLHAVLKDNSGAREQERATGISQVRSRTNTN